MLTKQSVYRNNRYKIFALIPLAALLMLAVACVNGSKENEQSNTAQGSKILFAVEAVKMNVIYVGVDNPVMIAASGIDQADLEVSVDNGKIRKEGDSYMINPAHTGTTTVNLLKDGKKLGSKVFRAKALEFPSSYLVLDDKRIESSMISIADLVRSTGISVAIPDFVFDVTFEVVSFNVRVTGIGGITIIQKSDSGLFTEQQTDLLRRLRPGQSIIIQEIHAIGPDGITRELNPMIFEII